MSTQIDYSQLADDAIHDRLAKIENIVTESHQVTKSLGGKLDDISQSSIVNHKELIARLSLIQSQNNELNVTIVSLKKELQANSNDRIIRIVAVSFLIFFSASLFLKITYDQTIVDYGLSKLGILISGVFLLIGYLIKGMVKEIVIHE